MREQHNPRPAHRPVAARNRFTLALLLIAGVVAIAPLLSRAQTTTSLRIVNNSTREIHNLFLSPVNSDAWGADQLDNSVIGANQTQTLSGLTCEGDEVKVIAEDQNGCFMTQVVACGGEAEWVVTNNTAADCGN